MGTRQITPADKSPKAYFWPVPWRYVVVEDGKVREDAGPFDSLTAACTHLRENNPDAWAMNGPESQPKEIPEPCQTDPF